METLFALCAIGAEKVLSNELKLLGYNTLSHEPGRISFESTLDGMYRANLCLRTADRVYLQAGCFYAENFDDLFDGVQSIRWQDYLKKDSRVVVDKVRTHKSKLSSEHAVQSMVHKAIYKKLGNLWHMETLPESGDEVDIRVYLEENTCYVLLDLSGLPLHKRGYRTEGGIAPLRETTAAALLQFMLWRRKTPLHDPFCGSGTIAIEATLYAHNVAPGFGRRFAVENLPFFDAERALEIKRAEAEKIRPDVQMRITGTDIDPAAIEIARQNAEHACVMAGRALQLIGSDARIERPDFEVADFQELSAPYEQGVIISNPPYGERLGDQEEAYALYQKMCALFDDFSGWNMGFITSHPRFEEALGRTATGRRKLKFGNLDTCFYIF